MLQKIDDWSSTGIDVNTRPGIIHYLVIFSYIVKTSIIWMMMRHLSICSISVSAAIVACNYFEMHMHLKRIWVTSEGV